MDTVRYRGPLWICNFALKPLDYHPASETLSAYGFTTEQHQCSSSSPFHPSSEEFNATIAFNDTAGNDAKAENKMGYLYARLYVSRPSRVARNLEYR